MNLTEESPFTTESPQIEREQAIEFLQGKQPLYPLYAQASELRNRFFTNKVRIHILDNIRNGYCPEECSYCAQRKNADSGVETFSLKKPEEIFQDAIKAKENGAYRFCMVSSGTGPSDNFLDKYVPLIEKINGELGMKVCLSAGILDEAKAKTLKEAGLDRYNHNLNTSESHYSEICKSHEYIDRVRTLEVLKQNGIGACSGLIVGLGESHADLVDIATELNRLRVASIPVNFFIPISGHAIKNPGVLTPEFCLRVLIMFRLFNPDAEVRIGAGREGHLRGLQSMALFAANSLFVSGYLNVEGSDFQQTVQMIEDAGLKAELADGTVVELPEGQKSNGYHEQDIARMYKYKK